jgi:hypothetical protein
MPAVEQLELLAAVKAHTFELETARVVSSGPHRADLERRMDDALRLLEWLSLVLETDRQACPATRTPPQSSAPVARNRSPTQSLDPTPYRPLEPDWAPQS